MGKMKGARDAKRVSLRAREQEERRGLCTSTPYATGAKRQESRLILNLMIFQFLNAAQLLA